MPNPGPRIDLLVNAVGSWNSVRVGQPFQHLRQQGWDVRMHEPPIVPNQAVRPHSLVIWQRPLPANTENWLQALRMIRSRGSLLVVEWDDHPDLFPPHIRQQLEQTNCCHLRMAHALQVSCSRLAAALSRYHPLALVVENGVDPIPALNLDKHRRPEPLRVFIGNLNREDEHRQLQPALEAWLHEDPRVQLVCAGPSGLNLRVASAQLEQHPLQPYNAYRRLLASCHIALLPLQNGQPQACKTPIKWLEAAAESTVVVGGPELYRPWLQNERYGLWSEDGPQMIAAARRLEVDGELRIAMAQRAHGAIQAHALPLQSQWRAELYRHLWRLRHALDAQLVQRHPRVQTERA